jgi:hypothetical protein
MENCQKEKEGEALRMDETDVQSILMLLEFYENGLHSKTNVSAPPLALVHIW